MTPLRNGIFLLLCLCLLLGLSPAAGAEDIMAEDISKVSTITAHDGFRLQVKLFDGDITLYRVKSGATVTFSHEKGIGSLYILLQEACGEYVLTNEDTGETAPLGTWDFLQEYVDVEGIFGTAPQSVTLTFPDGADLFEMYVFTPGQVPDFVHKWEPPAEGEADIVIFSTHGDDEQLFFAGTMPYYAGELGKTVQVVYLTGHQDTFYPHRRSEMLNGLYAVGVRNYPVFGHFPDQLSTTLESGYWRFQSAGHDKQELLGFVVENLRRFQPLVALGHDIEGEYGHGQHMVYADLLMEASEITADPAQYPESAQRWGTWDTPKIYLHLYKENPIVLDWDQPLSSFDGMTAFEVSRDLGFPCHKSQYSDFLWYMTQAKTAAQFWEYSPCEFGLYRSTVGPDVEKNDFLENLATFHRPSGKSLNLTLRPIPKQPGLFTVR